MKEFEWAQSYYSRNTTDSHKYNPPGTGDFRPRAFCPHCGFLVAEWDSDRQQDRNRWKWHRENAKVNAHAQLPPSPLLYWGIEEIPAELVVYDKDYIDLKLVKQLFSEHIHSKTELTTDEMKASESERSVGQQKPLSKFRKTKQTDDPTSAATILFDQALPATPATTLDYVQKKYPDFRRAWGSEKLYSGSYDEMKTLVLANLHRIHSEEGFMMFKIEVYKQDSASQVSCFFSDYFVGIRVWRVGDDYMACGNKLFQ
jgi:hypothetical protein